MDEAKFYQKVQVIVVLLFLLGLAVGIFVGWKVGVIQSNSYYEEYILDYCSCFLTLY